MQNDFGMIQEEFDFMPKKPRPDKKGEEVKERFQSFLIEEFKKIYPGDDVVDIVEYLYEQIVEYRETDGYKLAKGIDYKFGCNSDFEIAETFNEFHYELDSIYNDIIKEWIIDQKIECPFSIGEKVHIRFNNSLINGIVKDIYEKFGKISIYCESLGKNTININSNYEDVLKI